MYSISGLPPEVSGVPLATANGGELTLPAPTVASVLAGTVVVFLTTVARAVPVGPLALVLPEFEDVLWFAANTTKTTATTTTTTTAPTATKIRFRTWRRRSAAR